MSRFALVVWATLASWSLAQAQEAKVPVLVEARLGEETQLWQFELYASGAPATTIQQHAWQSLFSLYDRDHDGQLSPAESDTLPSPFGIRQLPTGRVLPTMIAPREPLDANGDDTIDIAEFTRYYQSGGNFGVLVTYGIAPNNAQLSQVLADKLGLRENEVLTEEDVQESARELMSLDANADELVGPGELIPGFKYPGTTATRLIRDTQGQQLPFALVTSSNRSSALRWTIDVQERTLLRDGSPESVDMLRSPSCWLRLHVADSAEGEAHARLQHVARQYEDLAASLDGTVTREDVQQRPNQIDMKYLVPLADADRDGTLTSQEVANWQQVFGQLLESVFVVSILDFEQNLFTCLDENHDGSLSSSELDNAWQQLQTAGVLVDGKCLPDKLPRQIRIVAALGFPQQITQQRSHTGPAWFQAMDRNRDGHISLSEFPAGEEPFRQLDTNGDGKISLSDLPAEN